MAYALIRLMVCLHRWGVERGRSSFPNKLPN